MKLLPVTWLESIDSTNSYIKRKLERGDTLPSGTVISARTQTAGRGRNSRIWNQAPGQDIAVSIYLNLSQEPASLLPLPLVIGLATRQTVENLGICANVKWPNDLLVSGRKISGVLMENVPARAPGSHIIIGIGLNVNMPQADSQRIDKPATSLAIELGHQLDMPQVLEQLLGSVEFYLGEFLRDGFTKLRENWLTATADLGAPVAVETPGGRIVGSIASVGKSGELIIKNPAGELVEIWAGDVTRL